MSKLFPKLGKSITVAAKAGGPDPSMNAALRTAIANAKAENMPKDKIDAAIKRASGKDALDLQEISYEGKGPHGVLIFIECATDNSTRTVANVKSYFNKAGGGLVPGGSLEYMFNRKAVFEFSLTEGKDVEELELEMIDHGLEEIETRETEEDAPSYVAYGDYTSFGSLAQAFEEQQIEVKKASLQRLPTSPIQLSEEQLDEVEKLLDKLEDDEDVQSVFTNIE